MSLYRGRYRIESARWPAWDYGAPGCYFVTICAQGRFFGEIFSDGTMWLSAVGVQAVRSWTAIPHHFPRVIPDTFVVMPNHVHGIVALAPKPTAREDLTVETRHVASLRRRFGPLQRGSLPTIVGQYKAAVTRWARQNGVCDFAWQARYHDRVIRSEWELANVRRYIAENPQRWLDRQRTSTGEVASGRP